MKYCVNFFLVLLIIILIFGLLPFRQTIDAEKALVVETGVYATEVRRLPDATYLVAVRTPMPEVKADMVRWWFSDFLQTTEHYNWWHPKDHVWMDWENKEPGKIKGASHLVHEYIGGDLSKLRIQFVNSSEFFGYDANDEDTFVICAKVGLLDEALNIAKMCHVVRNTLDGAEMRSRFWLGHVAKREGNKTVSSLKGFIGNTALTRVLVLNQQNAKDLKRHAEEEMKYLAELLPPLYRLKNND
jgi:hypothetical protein|tara:strand:- start:4552 stop:5280 length:729 start_codon:yes stop_codon:yes gene_type:complete